MNKTITRKLYNESSDDISNLLELALKNMDYDNSEIIHYTFLLEEALLKWREAFASDAELEISRENSSKDVIFYFSIEGEKCDPFVPEEDETTGQMVDRLLSGIGRELKFRYRKGRGKHGEGLNIIELKLPKKNHEDVLYKRMLTALMVPLAFQGLVENLATCIDTFMLGFVDASSMSAVSLASQFNNIHMLIITAVTIAETMLIAQYWGKRERGSVANTLRVAIELGSVVSILFFFAAFFFPQYIMAFYTNEAELIGQGAVYLRCIAFSYLIIPFVRAYYSYMRTTGIVSVVSLYTLIGCIVNAILNAILIFGLFNIEAMGVRGAGIATVISTLFQLALIINYNRAHKQSYRFTEDNSNIKDIRKLLISKAAPVLLQFASYLLGVNIIAAAFGRMGPDVIAANALISTVTTIFINMKNGVGNGAGILIGAKLGRNEMDKAWRYSLITYRYGAAIAAVIVLALDLCLLLIRFTSVELSDASWRYLWMLAIVVSINAFCGFINAVSNNGCMFAGGDSVSVLVIDALVMGLVLIPLALIGIFTNWIGAVPLMLLLKTDEIISCPLKFYRVQQKKWLRNIVE